MTWAKIDDNFCDHPKVVQAGPVAIGLWTCALSYCAKYLTDGFIPTNQVKRILIDLDDPMQVAEKLVSVGLWEMSDGGFIFHDYLVYNPSKEQVLKDRQETKAACHQFTRSDTLASTHVLATYLANGTRWIAPDSMRWISSSGSVHRAPLIAARA